MKYSLCFYLLFATASLLGSDHDISQKNQAPKSIEELPALSEEKIDCATLCPKKPWYFEVKPGYFYFSDSDMREFFDDGGFIIRAESGCLFHKGLGVWIEGSYFQKDGKAIGGTESLEIKIATITLGLKGVFEVNRRFAIHLGAGPRVFMLLLDNDSPFVRSQDNAVNVGGGFDAGFWVFPIPVWPNFYIDGFADYSWRKMSIEPDVNSSVNSSIDVSGLTAGGGIGIKF